MGRISGWERGRVPHSLEGLKRLGETPLVFGVGGLKMRAAGLGVESRGRPTRGMLGGRTRRIVVVVFVVLVVVPVAPARRRGRTLMAWRTLLLRRTRCFGEVWQGLRLALSGCWRSRSDGMVGEVGAGRRLGLWARLSRRGWALRERGGWGCGRETLVQSCSCRSYQPERPRLVGAGSRGFQSVFDGLFHDTGL